MDWQTPKTNWAAADGVRDSDLNRIEGNILELYNADVLRTDTMLYVSTEGSDTTGDGSSSSPYRTISKALEMLPKNTGGKAAEIRIASGTYAEDVYIKGYSGVLVLTGGYNTNVVVDSFTVEGCVCYLDGVNLTLVGGSVSVVNGATLISSAMISVSAASISLNVNRGSRAVITTLESVAAAEYGLFVDGASHVSITNLTGDENATGIIVQGGSIVAYLNNNMNAMDSEYLMYSGGRIYTGSSGIN